MRGVYANQNTVVLIDDAYVVLYNLAGKICSSISHLIHGVEMVSTQELGLDLDETLAKLSVQRTTGLDERECGVLIREAKPFRV
jgi:hypothetical protein